MQDPKRFCWNDCMASHANNLGQFGIAQKKTQQRRITIEMHKTQSINCHYGFLVEFHSQFNYEYQIKYEWNFCIYNESPPALDLQIKWLRAQSKHATFSPAIFRLDAGTGHVTWKSLSDIWITSMNSDRISAPNNRQRIWAMIIAQTMG